MIMDPNRSLDGPEDNDIGRPDGNLRIYLPDGHIEDGGFRKLWAYTGLPYPRGRDYVIELKEREFNQLGYPKDGVNSVTIIMRRPHDIPRSVTKTGVGVSGMDLIVDRFGMPIPENKDDFYRGLQNNGVMHLFDMGCRPAYIAAAFPADYNVRYMESVKPATSERDPQHVVPLIATEFSKISREVVENNMGFRRDEYEIEEIGGKAEPWPFVGDSHGMIDVTETGDSMRKHNLMVVEPLVMEKVTPHMLANQRTYNEHKPVIDEIVKRLAVGRANLSKEDPDIFKDKLITEGLIA